MSFPHHFLRLLLGPNQPATDGIPVVARSEVQWDSPVFRPPVLPTPNQISGEVPFTENLRPLFGRRH
jgi:hypothetical protein